MEGYPGKGSVSEVSNRWRLPCQSRPRVLCSSRLQLAAAGSRVPAFNRPCLSILCLSLGPGGAHGGTPLGASEGVLGGAGGRPCAPGGTLGGSTGARGARTWSCRGAQQAGWRGVRRPQGRGCDRGGPGLRGGTDWCPRAESLGLSWVSQGPDGTLWQALGDSAGQGVPGACGPGRVGAGRLDSLVRAGPGRACQILVGIGHFPYCKDC